MYSVKLKGGQGSTWNERKVRGALPFVSPSDELGENECVAGPLVVLF